MVGTLHLVGACIEYVVSYLYQVETYTDPLGHFVPLGFYLRILLGGKTCLRRFTPIQAPVRGYLGAVVATERPVVRIP